MPSDERSMHYFAVEKAKRLYYNGLIKEAIPMKRILTIFTVAALLFTLTACGSAPTSSSSAPADTTTTSSAANETTTTTAGSTSKSSTSRSRVSQTTVTTTTAAPKAELLDELANTKYLLTQKKKLTVGYIGGSITNGTGAPNPEDCWREKTTAWLKASYPDAAITDINAAIGATGSYYGKNRIDFHLLDKKPDLVFIEFVVNDQIEGASFRESAENMETMVRKCLASNPNMDIVFVYTTTVALGGNSNTAINAFNTVARHYGIEIIDVGAAMKNSGQSLDELFVISDKIHPNKKGYAVMANEVSARLTTILADAGNPKALKAHNVPDLLYAAVNINTKAYDADALHAQNPHLELMTDKLPYGADKRVRLNPGDTFTFTFKGTSVGIYWYATDTAAVTQTCTLEDGRTYSRPMNIGRNSIVEPLFEGLDKTKEHTITITYKGSEFMVIPYIFTTV